MSHSKWTRGPVDPWTHGVAESRSCGPAESWTRGAGEPWTRLGRETMRWFQRHPRAVIAALGVFLIVAGSTAVGLLNVRNLQRIDAIHERMADLDRLRSLRQRLEISLLDHVREAVPAGSFLAEDVHLQVENALALEEFLDAESAAGLRRIEELLSRSDEVSRETLVNALELAGSVYQRETDVQEELLARVRSDARRESTTGIAVIVALAVLAGIAAWLVPKRLLDPLAHLRAQFQDLGAGRFREVSLEGVDAALVPLFQNYNTLVARLQELEEERKLRAENLEGEVRSGARVLLEQQQVLADAERLAVVGETAAGLAHELRNPLAGILAALENLNREVTSPDLAPRLGLLRQEAERVVHRLNDYLAASRHAPEPPVPTDVGELVGDLLSLLRYQAPSSVDLKENVEEGLRCLLPQGRVRQALMNLVVNSLHALGSTPGTVEVIARGEEGGLELEVRDDGPGFPEEILDLAGQPFRTGRSSGTGLGLAMVQRLASDLGGTMTITNRANSTGAVPPVESVPADWPMEPRGASVMVRLPCEMGRRR